MKTISTVFGAAAAALILGAPALAQDTPPAPTTAQTADQATATPDAAQPEGAAPANPHAMLPALTGGPLGSPTALRGNPVPGTSTSIPTTNPARVMPLPAREGKPVERENTGIDGQCDPVVSLGECPAPPAASATQAAATGAATADTAVAPAAAEADPAGTNGSED